MQRWLLIVCLALVCLAFGSCGRERRTVLTLAHGLPTDHPVHAGMVRLAERVTELSGGTMVVRVYPAEQLGSERQALELVQLGSLDMSKTSAAVLESFAPAYSILSLPYLFRDDAHRFAVLDGPVGREMLLAGEPAFLRGLAFYDAGWRSFYGSRAIHTPADLSGLRVRVQESPSAMRMVTLLGGKPTPIAWGELYTSLDTGLVDAAENNPPSLETSKHYETRTVKAFSLDEHTAVPDVLVISTRTWAGLSEQQRKWLQQAADESVVYQRELWRERTQKSLEVVRAAGVEVVAVDKGPFQAAVEPMYASLDTAARQTVERIRATAGKPAASTPRDTEGAKEPGGTVDAPHANGPVVDQPIPGSAP